VSLFIDVNEATRAWLAAWKTGPTRTRWNMLPLQVGDKAPVLGLRTSEGESVDLADFWADGPALVLFLRHFGCGCAVERAHRLKDEWGQYAALGGNVVVIGQGDPERSAAFKTEHAIPCPVLCDPDRSAYQAFGLLEGQPSQILYDAPEDLQRRDPEAGAQFAITRREQGRPPVDSPWQMPGEFVVDAAGTIRLAYRYQYCEDFPDPRVLDAALREAARDRADQR
jgi:peroxiredoxin